MDRQCSSCGGFCRKSGCERENVQPEPEPVAWISHNAGLYHGKPDESLNPLPLYTTPPQREWVGLTDEEVSQMEKDCLWGGKDFNGNLGYWAVYRAIEAKLKEKNA